MNGLSNITFIDYRILMMLGSFDGRVCVTAMSFTCTNLSGTVAFQCRVKQEFCGILGTIYKSKRCKFLQCNQLWFPIIKTLHRKNLNGFCSLELGPCNEQDHLKKGEGVGACQLTVYLTFVKF